MKTLLNSIAEILRFIFRRLYLLIYLGRKHFFRSLFSSIGLLLSLVVVITSLGVLRPIKEILISKIESSLPSEIIRVTAPQKNESVNVLSFLNRSVGDRSIGMSSRQVRRLRKIPEVSSLYYSQVLQQPATASLDHSIFKQMGLRSDIMIQGISPSLVRPYLKCMGSFRPSTVTENGKKMTILPLVVPETYAEIAYAYSMIHNLPVLKPADLIGIRLKINLGDSIIGTRGTVQKTIYGKICGFVPQGLVTALGAPIRWVWSTHRSVDQIKAVNSYDQAFLKVENPKDIDTVRRKVRRMGLDFPKQGRKYNELYTIINRIDVVFWGLAAILMILTVIALGNSFTLLAVEKKYEFGLYLVFGASSVFIWFMMFLEGAFWGFTYSMLSLYISDDFLAWLQKSVQDAPWLTSVFEEEWQKIKLQIKPGEKTTIVIATTLITGFASFLPAFLMLGRKTLSLVKKD